jgi:hypothetical protein
METFSMALLVWICGCSLRRERFRGRNTHSITGTTKSGIDSRDALSGIEERMPDFRSELRVVSP